MMSMAQWEAASLKSSSRGEPSFAHKASRAIRAAGHKPTRAQECELGGLMMKTQNEHGDVSAVAAQYIADNFGG